MAGSYTTKFGAEDAGFTSTINKIKGSTKSMDDSIKSVSASVGASFASMVKAGAAMAVGFGAVKLAINAVKGVVNEFGDALDLGGELNDLSSRTGETAGNLLILQRSFDNAGSSADKVGPTINKLQKFMDDAPQGGAKQAETMSRLGVSLEELKGKTPLEQMQIFAERISAIQDPTERSALAMQVFGKSGGELLPMLQNFSGEIETARSQLGAMPDVMNRSNAAFDTISDNLSVIQTKLRDFAAGFLDRLAPAIEFATTMLTRFDAAAAGMKLGDIMIGAGNGVFAFNDALKALKFGETTLSWEIAFTAFKLSAIESFNSIYKNIVASMSAAGAFIKEVFGPTSGIFNAISLGFDIIGLKLQKSISAAFIGIAEAIPGIGGEMARSIAESMQKAESDINLSIWAIKQSMGKIPNDFVQGINNANEAFDKTLKTSKDLIDTTDLQGKLFERQVELQYKIEESIKNQGLASEQYEFRRKTLQEQYKKTLVVIANLEHEIKEAKMLGDTTRVKELERQLAIEKLIAEEIKNGKTYQEALAIAKQKQADADANILANEKEKTKELQKQLSLSEQLQETLEEKIAREQIDPRGKIENKINEAIDANNFKKAQREINKLFDKENAAAAKNLFADLKRQQELDKQLEGGRELEDAQREADKELKKAMRMSPIDIAKELGIDISGKKRDELQREIKNELEKRKSDEVEKAKKEAPATPKEAKQEQQQERLGGVVGEILGVCKEIAKKLPQQALGY